MAKKNKSNGGGTVKQAASNPDAASIREGVASDLRPKRLNIATNAVIYATAFLDALLALDRLRDERAIAGNFVDADFLGTDLTHLDAFTIGSLLDNVMPAFKALYTGTNKDVLNAVRR